MQKRITTVVVFAAVLLMAYMYSGKTDCVIFGWGAAFIPL